MGIAVIVQSFKKEKIEDDKEQKRKKENRKKQKPKMYKFFIRPLGITIEIIRNPIFSDLDNSHTIDAKEAIYLGLATSCDAFASGIGISTFGVNGVLFPLFVAIFQLVFLSFGNFLGKKIRVCYKNSF